MSHVTFTEFRANMAKHMDKLEQDRDQLVVTRQGHEPMVVMPLKDLEGWEETLYLLGNPANAERLLKSISDLDAGKQIEVNPETMQLMR
jgi:antitoxin YefM